MRQGKVKIKENGLPAGHPEKDGVTVDIADLVAEVKKRIKRKADLENVAQQAAGLKVVEGIKGQEVDVSVLALQTENPLEDATALQNVKEEIGAVPAS